MDGARYLAILRSVGDDDWWDVRVALGQRVGPAIVPERVAHRQAKARALAAEDRRRRAGEWPKPPPD